MEFLRRWLRPKAASPNGSSSSPGPASAYDSKFRSLLETAPDAIVVIRSDGTLVLVNAQAEMMFRYRRHELVGKPLSILLSERFQHLSPGRSDGLSSGAPTWQMGSGLDLACRRKDGSEFPAEISLSSMATDDGVWVTGVIRDTSERQRAARALEESEAKFRRVFEDGPVGMVMIDPGFRIVRANQAFCRMLGYAERELTRMTFLEITHPEDAGVDVEHVRKLFSGELGTYQREKRYITKDKETIWVNLTASLVRDRDGKALYGLGIVENVTERKRHEEGIRHLAFHDPLTGLPNRKLLLDRLSAALVEARKRQGLLSLFFLDLDQFKNINDTLGHEAGDRLLQEVAKRLQGLLRAEDTVARMGGDEFMILLPDIEQVEDAGRVAQKILDAFRIPFSAFEKDQHFITASIGIALHPYDGENAQMLLRNADTAMYRAKAEGRNTFRLYTLTMTARASEQLSLGNQLRQALEREEFVLHYQPQIDLNSGRVTGMEALVRWRHPKRGLLAPAEFLSPAEETGLIVPIGEWVLRTACRQNKAWQEAGLPPLRVAVNLAARQFQQKRLVVTVAGILHETGLDPRHLEMEVTEGVAIQDVEFSVEAMRALKEMGVQIVLDDFGTGYSSLGYLKRFPIDKLKLDKLFVHDLVTDPHDSAIATAVIVLAHSLRLKVIAEGIETQAQLDFLKGQACDEGQGYLFSPPLPAGDFATLAVRRLWEKK